MPTSYTSIIHDRDDATFAEFVWTCARAFGAFIEQRDDSLNTPPVMKETPASFYDTNLHAAEASLRRFDAMSDAELMAEQESYITDARRNAEEGIRKTEALRSRYESMLAAVEAWEPPTRDHQGLKDFMRQQLDDSIAFDCVDTYWRDQLTIKPMDVAQYRRERRSALVRSVERARTSLAEERNRVARRNEWKRALVESVPLPETVTTV